MIIISNSEAHRPSISKHLQQLNMIEKYLQDLVTLG